MSIELLKDFDFSNRSDWEPVAGLLVNLDLLERVQSISNFRAVDFTKGTFVDELLVDKDLGRSKFEVGDELPLDSILCLRFRLADSEHTNVQVGTFTRFPLLEQLG